MKLTGGKAWARTGLVCNYGKNIVCHYVSTMFFCLLEWKNVSSLDSTPMVTSKLPAVVNCVPHIVTATSAKYQMCSASTESKMLT